MQVSSRRLMAMPARVSDLSPEARNGDYVVGEVHGLLSGRTGQKVEFFLCPRTIYHSTFFLKSIG